MPADPEDPRVYLGDTAWPDLAGYFEEESLALVPVGSTEQHGPHLPEATDAIIAEGFARGAARRTGYLCTPTIDIGVSPHHRQFHGTTWADRRFVLAGGRRRDRTRGSRCWRGRNGRTRWWDTSTGRGSEKRWAS